LVKKKVSNKYEIIETVVVTVSERRFVKAVLTAKATFDVVGRTESMLI
jgi:hypothetical protein